MVDNSSSKNKINKRLKKIRKKKSCSKINYIFLLGKYIFQIFFILYLCKMFLVHNAVNYTT